MRSSVTAVLVAGVAAQLTSMPALSAAPAPVSFGSTASASTSGLPLGATSFGATSLGAAPTATPAPSATTRGIPIGTVNGIQDSDVVCAQMGGQGAACGLPNVPSIYNPNPALRYQTQYSDNDLALLQSTNRYNANGQRIVNPTGSAALNAGTLDIPTQNAAASGVTTTLGNQVVQSTTNWLNNGALANYITPSASNAVLPNSVAFAQANIAPGTTTPVNTLTGAGFGYSTNLGFTAGSVQAPVPSTTSYLGASSYLPATSYLGASSYLPATSYLGASSYLPATTLGTSSYFPTTLGATSYLPATSFGSSYLPTTTVGAGYFPTTTFGSTFGTTLPSTYGLGSTYQLPAYNPAAQPFTNAYSTPGLVGPPSQAGITTRF